MTLIYLQTLSLASTSIRYWGSLIVLEGLEMLSIYAFTIAWGGYDWVWFGLASLFWVSIVGMLLGPIMKIMRTKSSRVYSLYNTATWFILILEV
jgi:hypothetical protein